MRNLALAYYVGILDGAKDVWGVRIPDVPGCYGGGATPEAALADVISALREFAAHQATRGITLDRPRKVQEVIRDKAAEFDAAAGEAVVLVPLLLDQARPVKANISLDAGLLEAIDAEAERRGLTGSAFLTSAAIDKIEASARERPAGPARKRRSQENQVRIAGKARAQ
jgi:predicted RNase H-like HicB family nuclease